MIPPTSNIVDKSALWEAPRLAKEIEMVISALWWTIGDLSINYLLEDWIYNGNQ